MQYKAKHIGHILLQQLHFRTMDQYKCKEMAADSVDESHRRPRKRSLLYCLAVVATSLVFVSFAFGLFAMQSNINHLAAVVRDQAETLSDTSSNIHHLASRVSELSSNVDHLAATVKDQAEMLSAMSSKIHHLEGELSSNVDRLATTVEDQADKLSEMERQLAANEETQRNLSVHHSALESRVASIGQQLVEDETNYHEYLLNLQRNLTEMLEDKLSAQDTMTVSWSLSSSRLERPTGTWSNWAPRLADP